jgi:ribosome biogenesis GTPase
LREARVVLIEKGGAFLDDDELVVFPRRLRRAGATLAVGDYVRVAGGAITEVLPRRTKLSRRAAGDKASEQLVAANVDRVFIVCGLDRDFNMRRIERYLVAMRSGGAEAAVLLNKADLVEDPAARVVEVAALGVPVHLISAREGTGLDALAIGPGETVCFVGSSGAGKSTLLNRLLGRDAQRTGEVRGGDDRGRHTTSSRELFAVPGGGFVIDTPGMRELGLWDAEEGMAATFADLEELAQKCRFRDCRHDREPGCAVRGVLDDARLADWRKLHSELAAQEKKRY